MAAWSLVKPITVLAIIKPEGQSYLHQDFIFD